MDTIKIIREYNNCINSRDIAGLSRLMHDNYRFVDSSGMSENGKLENLNSWDIFLKQFPDYRHFFINIQEKKEIVVITGYSLCSIKTLSGPAIWTAKIEDGKVREWRVYNDSRENRAILGLHTSID